MPVSRRRNVRNRRANSTERSQSRKFFILFFLFIGLSYLTYHITKFQPEKKTRPYLLGGLGYGRTTWKGETKPGAGYVWADTSTSEYRTNFDEDMSALSFSFGAGLETTMSENVSLAFEARWRTIRADDTIADKLFPLKWEAEAANAFLLTAGLNWKFGK